MRKLIWIAIFFGIFYLQGCEKEPEPELICGTNEENVNGVCETILEPEEIALRNALTYADDMSNYQMDIIIQFDDEKSSFEMNLQKEYFERFQGVLYQYAPAGSQYVKTAVEDSSSDAYAFFKDFDPSWFTYSTDKYLLNIENHDDVQLFFQSTFPGSVISNFEMFITDDYISKMDFMLQVGEINYHLVFEISNVGTVDIILPVV